MSILAFMILNIELILKRAVTSTSIVGSRKPFSTSKVLPSLVAVYPPLHKSLICQICWSFYLSYI